MKLMLILSIVCCAVIASASPSLPFHHGVGGFYRGPNSETIIRGPDGSVITAASHGGEVHTPLEPIVVAEPAVVQEIVPVTRVTPVIETVSPLVETVEINAPIIDTQQNSDLVGPSGIISTRGSHSVVAGPASTTITGPAGLAGIVSSTVPVVSVTGGHEGVTALPVADVAVSNPVVADSVALSSAPQASASASASPHHSVATASSSSSAIVTATAGPNVASASVKTLPAPTVVSTSVPIISSTVKPLILPNSAWKSHGVTINGQADLTETNRIYLPAVPSNTLAPPILVSNSKTISPLSVSSVAPISPLVSSTVGGSYVVSSTPAPIVAINPVTLSTLRAHPVGSPAVVSNQATPILTSTSNVQRYETDGAVALEGEIGATIEPLRTVALSKSQQIALAQQQALLRNEITANPNLIHVTPTPDLGLHTISTLSDAQQQAIWNAELAKQGIDPLSLHLASVPWSGVSEVPSDWARYGRDVNNEEKQIKKDDVKELIQ